MVHIHSIVRYLECEPETLYRVPCPFCRNGRALLLVPSTGVYECQICQKYGKLDELVVIAADSFEHRHKDTLRMMTRRRR